MGWTKPKNVPENRTQPRSLRWRACEGMWDVKYRPQRQLGGLRWEFFAQEEISISSQENLVLPVGLGVRMTKGRCRISLNPKFIEAGCRLLSDTVTDFAEDMLLDIKNFNDLETVVINEGDSLCYVNYELL
jgi:hypothetical protein